jgi:hypothetical protein
MANLFSAAVLDHESQEFRGFPDLAALKRPGSRRTPAKLVAARRHALCYSGSNVYGRPVQGTASARISRHRFDGSDLSRLIHALLEQSAQAAIQRAFGRKLVQRLLALGSKPNRLYGSGRFGRTAPVRANAVISRRLRAVKFNPSRSSSKT